MTRATLAQASAWLLSIATAFQEFDQKSGESDKDCLRRTKIRVMPIAASLAKNYGMEVFRPESRESVSAGLKWFREPDIRERLDAWVRINAPDAVEILHPDAAMAPISEVARWHYSHMLSAKDEATAVRALDTLRSREHEAFDWVVRNDVAAAGWAVRHRWGPTPARNELAIDWDDEARIRDLAARIRTMPCATVWASRIREQAIASLLMTVGLHARQHLDAAVAELRSHAEVEQVAVAFPENGSLFGGIA